MGITEKQGLFPANLDLKFKTQMPGMCKSLTEILAAEL
jgi:hypothetical protein